ncbi:MAG: hypothetical protein ACLFQK_03560 [Fibrobacterota bacterium]
MTDKKNIKKVRSENEYVPDIEKKRALIFGLLAAMGLAAIIIQNLVR